MERPAEESNMSPDRFTAGKSADRLINDRLKNGCGQIFFGSALIDQGLNIRFCKNAAACRYRVKRTVIFSVFVKTRSVCLDQGSHLVDKGACTAGTDPVHTLFHISAFEINNLGVFTAKFNSHVRLRSQFF